MAAQPGLEPGKADPNSAVLPITPPGNVIKPNYKQNPSSTTFKNAKAVVMAFNEHQRVLFQKNRLNQLL